MTRQTSRRRFLKATAATGAVASLNVAVLAQDGGQEETVILIGGNTPGWLGYRLPQEEADDSQNPTLNLQTGTTYTLLWQNVDGVGHNFAIQDSNGDNLEVLQPLSVEQDVYEDVNGTDPSESVSLEVSDGNVTGVTTGNESDGGMENDSDDMGNQTDGETTVAEDELVSRTEIISTEGAVQAVRFTATSEMAQYICLVHPNTMVGDVSVEGGDGTGGAENNSSG
jgi:plastocyanin